MLAKFAYLSTLLISFPVLITGQDAGGEDKTGFSGELSSLDAGLQGTVNVVDSTTLEIPDFVIEDASAPALYWWGSTGDELGDGFRISEQEVVDEADGELLEIPLDSGFTTSDFSVVGLWCEEFNINFGQTALAATDGSGSSNGDSSSSGEAADSGEASATESDDESTSSSGSRDSSKSIFEPIIEDQYNSARAYFLSVVGLLFLESAFHLPLFLLILAKRGRPYIKSPGHHSIFHVFLHKLNTLPSLIPFITTHKIPDYFRLGAFIGLNVLFAWNQNEFSSQFNRYGWMTIANGGLALLLAARSNLFALIIRIPSSTLLLYHRWIGRATAIHATIHFALNLDRWIETDQVATVFESSRIQVGLVAWIALCLIFITSIGFIRRKWFELFYYPHVLFLVFVIGAMIHASRGPEFLVPGLVLWVLDRVIRFVFNFSKIKITSVKQYPGQLTKIKFRGLRTYKPGQIAWIRFPNVSLFHWHPFTIASAPGQDEAVVAIRGIGGYSKRLYKLVATSNAAIESGTTELKLRAEGAHGVGSIEWGAYPVTVLVAGGVGITPGISIASYIIQRAAQDNIKMSAQQAWHVHILWVVKEETHLQWFEEELKQLAKITSDPSIPATLDVTIHVSGSSMPHGKSMTDDSSGYDSYRYTGPGVVFQGRPDINGWFERIRNMRVGLDAAVDACGPKPLVLSTRKAAAKVSWKQGLFHVEEEIFER